MIMTILMIVIIILSIIAVGIFILSVYDLIFGKENSKLSKLIIKTGTSLLAVSLLVASFTLFSSVDYSKKSLDLFDKNISELENISQTNKEIAMINQNISESNREIIDWYKNPEPLLRNLTNLFGDNMAFAGFYGLSRTFSDAIKDSRQIDIKLINDGREAAKGLTMYIDFENIGYGELSGGQTVEEHPLPFKIYEISTTPKTGSISYNFDKKYTSEYDFIKYCTDENGYFPTDNEYCSNISLNIKDIDVGEEKTIHITLFSISIASADMIVRIVDEDGSELQKITINVASTIVW